MSNVKVFGVDVLHFIGAGGASPSQHPSIPGHRTPRQEIQFSGDFNIFPHLSASEIRQDDSNARPVITPAPRPETKRDQAIPSDTMWAQWTVGILDRRKIPSSRGKSEGAGTRESMTAVSRTWLLEMPQTAKGKAGKVLGVEFWRKAIESKDSFRIYSSTFVQTCRTRLDLPSGRPNYLLANQKTSRPLLF